MFRPEGIGPLNSGSAPIRWREHPVPCRARATELLVIGLRRAICVIAPELDGKLVIVDALRHLREKILLDGLLRLAIQIAIVVAEQLQLTRGGSFLHCLLHGLLCRERNDLRRVDAPSVAAVAFGVLHFYFFHRWRGMPALALFREKLWPVVLSTMTAL